MHKIGGFHLSGNKPATFLLNKVHKHHGDHHRYVPNLLELFKSWLGNNELLDNNRIYLGLFQQVLVWESIRLQHASSQDERLLAPTQTVEAKLPSLEWPHGKYDFVVVWSDSVPGQSDVLEVHRIFKPDFKNLLFSVSANVNALDQYFLYGMQMSFKGGLNGHRARDESTDMYILDRPEVPRWRILPASNVQFRVNLIPRFGSKATAELKSNTVNFRTESFLLNFFGEDDTFHSILSREKAQ
ncbi:hypothetical protein CPB83DRAFT_900944 [Crepidotus variabilis]|uniref:DUF6830 domain-containing protein n=1 Tax=Crepidotus variabilis TaxID=179855 RepID=A0A9P6BC20_9AGAR|nr:hypothetical protein CPB83DRAFT_900944 [Crepidotus variabilis]